MYISLSGNAVRLFFYFNIRHKTNKILSLQKRCTYVHIWVFGGDMKEFYTTATLGKQITLSHIPIYGLNLFFRVAICKSMKEHTYTGYNKINHNKIQQVITVTTCAI